jgi:glycerol 2-dehydrogenase (NADP+)
MWGLSKGVSVLPKSVTESRIRSNLDLEECALSSEEVEKIDGIQKRFKVCGDAWLPVKVFFGDDE